MAEMGNNHFKGLLDIVQINISTEIHFNQAGTGTLKENKWLLTDVIMDNGKVKENDPNT